MLNLMEGERDSLFPVDREREREKRNNLLRVINFVILSTCIYPYL